LLALNSVGAFSDRVLTVRKTLKRARAQLVLYQREIVDRGLGVIPQHNCDEAIAAIDAAREEFGD